MKFERVSTYPDAILPSRATAHSAGYDFYVAEDTTIHAHAIKLVPTGIKAQIEERCYLQLAVRSSTPLKTGLMLANGIGIIDSDYYNNTSNEGHIMFQLYNSTAQDITLHKGDKIGQGVLLRYGITEDDVAGGLRVGGLGSTSNGANN